MRILLDTHVLLWALAEPKKLPKRIKSHLENAEDEILFSAANIWEIAIKSQIGKSSFGPALIAKSAVESGFVELPVRAEAAAMVAEIPLHHRDPFDRLLIAQAVSEPAVFCTVDETILSNYSDIAKFL
jgi:PIN domain nuclease of toxin-antitoxin system